MDCQYVKCEWGVRERIKGTCLVNVLFGSCLVMDVCNTPIIVITIALCIEKLHMHIILWKKLDD